MDEIKVVMEMNSSVTEAMSLRRFYLVVDGRAVDGAFFTELDAVARQSGVSDALGAAMASARKVISLGARRVDVMSEPWPMTHEGEPRRVYSVEKR